MWTRELFLGMDAYHFVAAFVIYSIIGWFVESVYMSFCEKKIVNRGFGKGPFCPIYGFGALGAFILFTPFYGNYLVIYLLGCLTATVFEYLVAKLMIRFCGDFWWDYNEKPFNYKGIICAESTLAWGIYALIIVHVLHGSVIRLVDKVSVRQGTIGIVIVFSLVAVDYCMQFYKLSRK